MSSNNEKDFIKCEFCEDQRGLCDRNFLVDDRRFSIKLDETFEVDTVSHFVNYYLNAKLMLNYEKRLVIVTYCIHFEGLIQLDAEAPSII